MKFTHDKKKCIGSGVCTTIAPSVFRFDDDGKLDVLKEEVDGAEIEAVKDAAACCPVDAIIVHQ